MTESNQPAGYITVHDHPEITAKIPFFMGENIIGRSNNKANIVIKEMAISQKHARLLVTPKSITITDIGSKNGTKINNETNLLESNVQVQIDEDMIVYLADIKCTFQRIKPSNPSVTVAKEVPQKYSENTVEISLRPKQQSQVETKPQIQVDQENSKQSYQNQFSIGQDFQANAKFQKKKPQFEKEDKKKKSAKNPQKEKANEAEKKVAEEAQKEQKKEEYFERETQGVHDNSKKDKKQIENQQKIQKIQESMQPLKNKRQKSKKRPQDDRIKQKQIQSQNNQSLSKIIKGNSKSNSKKPDKEKKQEKQKQKQKQVKPIKKVEKQKDQEEKLQKNQKEKHKDQEEKLEKNQKKDKDKKTNVPVKTQERNDKKESKQKSLRNSRVSPQAKNKQEKSGTKSRSRRSSPESKNNNKNKKNHSLLVPLTSIPSQSQQPSEVIQGRKTKQVNNRKRAPSASLLRQANELNPRRSFKNKRIVVSGFQAQLTKKYFLLIEDIDEQFDFLIMKQYKRTFKALFAICKGILILNYQWIRQSQSLQKTLNYANYKFKDIQYIYEAIDKTKKGFKVFKGYNFFLGSEQYHMKTDEIQILIYAAGGEVIKKVGKLNSKEKDSQNIVAVVRKQESQQRKNDIAKMKKLGFNKIYSLQFVLQSCERQEVDWGLTIQKQ